MDEITVYVLEGTARRYVGITNNLPRRLAEHRTSSHSGNLIGDFAVLHRETFPDYASARQRERFLKSGQGRAWLAERYPKPPRPTE
jgi:predicted GIY-YIG superfamily endonuclease